jgi:hypothetical protein
MYGKSLNKGMISKHGPPLSGLTGLVITSYTTNGLVRTLLLAPISTDTKLKGVYLKLKKVV